MEPIKLPADTGNPLLDTFRRLEDVEGCCVGFSPYGITANAEFHKGIYLNITTDPYVGFGTEIEDPDTVGSLTMRFVAYTTEDHITANILSLDDIQRMLNADDPAEREALTALKEFAGLELTVSGDDYRAAESALIQRESQEQKLMHEAQQML